MQQTLSGIDLAPILPPWLLAALAVLAAAAAPNRVKKRLRDWEPARKLIYQRTGLKLRAKIDRNALPRRESMLRNAIKREKLWLR